MVYEENDFDKLKECLRGKRLYLFGASGSARGFIKRQGGAFCIEGIFDNDIKKVNITFEGYPVFPVHKIPLLDKEKTVFLITSCYEKEIEKQLLELGMKYIYSSHMCERRGNGLAPVCEKDLTYVDSVREILADEHSKKRLEQIVQCRAGGIAYWNDMFDGKPYFQDVYPLTDSEVFVDAGAYIGDTIEEFIQHTRGQFRKIYAFEPDEINYQTLVTRYGGNNRIRCIQAGLYSDNTTLNFEESGTDGSKFIQRGGKVVECMSIDKFIDDEVSFIKMDIEGSELEALKGAEHTICKYHPKLAICIYHNDDDLWTIPLYIHKIVPRYKLYIRHHSLGFSDTVLYAVYSGRGEKIE
ncbi:MAG: FkbM family methyltransferase [Bacteroidales bacterium]|nr:FkbM family methyltransferase [Clostridium sp.]MCM1204360.1 FkbM family methyltransferase [Bacteroidales bacterium]